MVGMVGFKTENETKLLMKTFCGCTIQVVAGKEIVITVTKKPTIKVCSTSVFTSYVKCGTMLLFSIANILGIINSGILHLAVYVKS